MTRCSKRSNLEDNAPRDNERQIRAEDPSATCWKSVWRIAKGVKKTWKIRVFRVKLSSSRVQPPALAALRPFALRGVEQGLPGGTFRTKPLRRSKRPTRQCLLHSAQ